MSKCLESDFIVSALICDLSVFHGQEALPAICRIMQGATDWFWWNFPVDWSCRERKLSSVLISGVKWIVVDPPKRGWEMKQVAKRACIVQGKPENKACLMTIGKELQCVGAATLKYWFWLWDKYYVAPVTMPTPQIKGIKVAYMG